MASLTNNIRDVLIFIQTKLPESSNNNLLEALLDECISKYNDSNISEAKSVLMETYKSDLISIDNDLYQKLKVNRRNSPGSTRARKNANDIIIIIETLQNNRKTFDLKVANLRSAYSNSNLLTRIQQLEEMCEGYDTKLEQLELANRRLHTMYCDLVDNVETNKNAHTSAIKSLGDSLKQYMSDTHTNITVPNNDQENDTVLIALLIIILFLVSKDFSIETTEYVKSPNEVNKMTKPQISQSQGSTITTSTLTTPISSAMITNEIQMASASHNLNDNQTKEPLKDKPSFDISAPLSSFMNNVPVSGAVGGYTHTNTKDASNEPETSTRPKAKGTDQINNSRQTVTNPLPTNNDGTLMHHSTVKQDDLWSLTNYQNRVPAPDIGSNYPTFSTVSGSAMVPQPMVKQDDVILFATTDQQLATTGPKLNYPTSSAVSASAQHTGNVTLPTGNGMSPPIAGPMLAQHTSSVTLPTGNGMTPPIAGSMLITPTAGPKLVDIFLGGLNSNCTETIIQNYINNKLKIYIDPSMVVDLKARGLNKAFKVTIPRDKYQEALGIWKEDIVVKRFKHHKQIPGDYQRQGFNNAGNSNHRGKTFLGPKKRYLPYGNNW